MKTDPHFKNISIIIADDHPIFRSGLNVALSTLPYITKISQARDGTEVLSILKEEFHDVILMDIKMLPMDGLKATEIVKRDFPETKIIALSSHTEEGKIIGMLERGATGYLLKNAAAEEIAEAILTVIEGKKYFSKEVSETLAERLLNSLKGNEILLQDESMAGERMREIAFLISHGFNHNEIADMLCLSKRTIDYYIRKISDATGTKNHVSLMKYAIRAGILEDHHLNEKWRSKIGLR